MLYYIKLYTNLLISFFIIFVTIHQFRSYLERKNRFSKNYKLYRRPMDRAILMEKRGKAELSRQDMFLQLSSISLEAENQQDLREEMITPIMLALLLRCEPFKEIPTDEE